MPPRRPLPDVSLITVLKFLKPMDQLKASKMSPRLRLLVRAANRRVKTLIITNGDLTYTQKIINSFFISSRPNLQKLKDDCGGAIDFQPKAVRASKWNSLVFNESCQEDLPTVEEVATVLFSAVTSLVFIASDFDWIRFEEDCEYLVALLHYPPFHPHETTQLESLVLRLGEQFSSTMASASVTYEVVDALNALTALQQLAVDFDFGYGYPDMFALTLLDQLKVLVVKLACENDKLFFLGSIGEQAADNVNLKIHLQGGSDLYVSKYIDDWPEPLLSRVVTLEIDGNLFHRFPLLTSLRLTFDVPFSTNYRPLLALLSQHNRQLLHLYWKLDLILDRSSTLPFRSLPQLTSVRALTLDLDIRDHSQAEWLHLPWTLPNCQAIYLRHFYCWGCRVNLVWYLRGYYTEHSKPTNSATALKCLRDVLSKLYPYFQRQQITLGEVEPYRTAAELFAEPHE